MWQSSKLQNVSFSFVVSFFILICIHFPHTDKHTHKTKQPNSVFSRNNSMLRHRILCILSFVVCGFVFGLECLNTFVYKPEACTFLFNSRLTQLRTCDFYLELFSKVSEVKTKYGRKYKIKWLTVDKNYSKIRALFNQKQFKKSENHLNKNAFFELLIWSHFTDKTKFSVF